VSVRASDPVLLIPVEQQQRELDAKLLLACCAAERGFRVVLGSRHELHLRAARLPRGIYFAKSFRSLSVRIFEILRSLGSDVVACDEEALIPYPDALFFTRRVSPEAMALVSAFFAWGPASAALFMRCPGYPGAPVHDTGHPRGDLMRPELRPLLEESVRALRRRFGHFLLVNTNFGTVNHLVPSLGWLNDPEQTRLEALPPGYVDGLALHRRALFEHFQQMVPALARAFPDRQIVLRPHPVEDHAVWRRVAAGHGNVHVLHEGNVLPWLAAAAAVVHNGCTTGVEAFAMGTAAVAYRPLESEEHDLFLPNALGYAAATLPELCDRLRWIADGGRGAPDDPAQQKLLAQHLSAREGPLASDRIADALLEHLRAGRGPAEVDPAARLLARLHSEGRALVKRLQGLRRGNVNHPDFQKHRYPGVGQAQLEQRIADLGGTLGRFDGLRTRPLGRHLYEIGA
jgi:surface carbohydrate biosynthesis protein